MQVGVSVVPHIEGCGARVDGTIVVLNLHAPFIGRALALESLVYPVVLAFSPSGEAVTVGDGDQ